MEELGSVGECKLQEAGVGYGDNVAQAKLSVRKAARIHYRGDYGHTGKSGRKAVVPAAGIQSKKETHIVALAHNGRDDLRKSAGTQVSGEGS